MKATPKAAELAAELGVGLEQVEGSGKGGRVTVGDVRAAAEIEAPDVDLFASGGRVLSVFGAFGHRTLIELPTRLAMAMFREPLERSGPTDVVEALEQDLAAIREHAPAVADSTLAAAARRLAYELQDPFNSATSKSMCAKALIDALDGLRELAPPRQEADDLDELSARRATRLAGRAAASG